MRLAFAISAAFNIFVLIFPKITAQDQTEKSRVVQGGGIAVQGWTGKIGASEERAGQALSESTAPKYMNLNSHPHPYGLVIAANDPGTANQGYLYCAGSCADSARSRFE